LHLSAHKVARRTLPSVFILWLHTLKASQALIHVVCRVTLQVCVVFQRYLKR